MSSTTIVAPGATVFDETRLAVAGFLARYSGPTRVSYSCDLRQFFAWCAQVHLGVFELSRGHLELWARSMEERGLARATMA
jgi:integrase/recombinase XerD